ncbi:unnamed protein product [Calypogeia fissa]
MEGSAKSPGSDISWLDADRFVSTSTEFVQRIRYGSGTRFSNVRTLTPEDQEKGFNTYCKNNSLAFGQVVPVEDYVFQSDRFQSDRFQSNRFPSDRFPSDRFQSGRFQSEKLEKIVDLEAGKKLGDNQTVNGTETNKKGTDDPPKTTEITKTKGSSKIGGESRLKTIILEQTWFSVYKRLHLAAMIVNLLFLILASSGLFPYARSNAVVFSLGNIVMCVLVRNEVFLRAMFWLAVHLLGYWWVPLRLKTMTTALLQSVGGIHSGCGLGAIVWLVYALDHSFRNRHLASDAMLGIAIGILFLLFLSSLAAFPVLRHIYHNFFERVHRFAGWTSLGLVWAYVFLAAFWDPGTQSYRISNRTGKELARMQGLWLTVATTFMIILPWLGVRKVPVETLVPATKLNALITFQGGVQAGLLARISPSPFSEWHAFGIVSDGQKKHTLVAGSVGDFTISLVEMPPTHIWVRTFHFAGIPYLANMYEKSLLVATGSGIGVFLSFALQETRANAHLIWIAKKVRESYGDEMWEAVNRVPAERITLIDTALCGRPKTRELVVTKAKELKAEVVIVTSNPSCTNDVVNGCRAAGIPAFGPIWDS